MTDVSSGTGTGSPDGGPEPPLRREPRWPAAVALVVAMGFHVALPEEFVLGPVWLMPSLEVILLIPLLIANPDRVHRDTRVLRVGSILVISIVTVANTASLLLLVHDILGPHNAAGRTLVLSAIAIWGTQVIIFGLWYWELDSGGPVVRHCRKPEHRDFLFPQQASPDVFKEVWHPDFFDYLYTSFTNSTAFSPTDTMPLSVWAKGLMMTQSASAFVTIALVAARAVNILS